MYSWWLTSRSVHIPQRWAADWKEVQHHLLAVWKLICSSSSTGSFSFLFRVSYVNLTSKNRNKNYLKDNVTLVENKQTNETTASLWLHSFAYAIKMFLQIIKIKCDYSFYDMQVQEYVCIWYIKINIFQFEPKSCGRSTAVCPTAKNVDANHSLVVFSFSGNQARL